MMTMCTKYFWVHYHSHPGVLLLLFYSKLPLLFTVRNQSLNIDTNTSSYENQISMAPFTFNFGIEKGPLCLSLAFMVSALINDQDLIPKTSNSTCSTFSFLLALSTSFFCFTLLYSSLPGMGDQSGCFNQIQQPCEKNLREENVWSKQSIHGKVLNVWWWQTFFLLRSSVKSMLTCLYYKYDQVLHNRM